MTAGSRGDRQGRRDRGRRRDRPEGPDRTRGERLYRALLQLLPPWLRERYRDELLLAYRRDRQRERFRGPAGALRYWRHAVSDVIRTAVRERLDPSPIRAYERRSPRPGSWIVTEARHAMRGLRRAPGFTALATITLGLGLGAVTTVFAVVDGVLLAPLPYPEPDALVRVWERERDNPGARMVAYGNWVDLRSEGEVFEDLAIWAFASHTLTGRGDAVRLRSREVSANLADMLGVAPLHGRWISEDEARSGMRSVVLSYQLWQGRFAGDPAAVGRTIRLEGEPYTIVGVMPAGFDFPSGGEAWVPLEPVTDPVGARRWHRHNMVGRLVRDLDASTAQARLVPLARRLEQAYPRDNTGNYFEVQLLRESVVGSVRPALTTLFAACGLLLLIACVNLASLLLARATSRDREIATRGALGASPSQLGWFVAWESLFLSGAGAVLGFAAAAWAVGVIRVAAAGIIPRVDQIRIGLPMFGFVAGVAFLCALGVSLAPIMRGRRSTVSLALRQGWSSSVLGTVRQRRHLVVAQLSLAVVLVVGAGLLLKSLARMGSVDSGVQEETSLVTLDVRVPVGDRDDQAYAVHVAELLRTLEAAPGIERAAAVLTEPANPGGWFNSLTIRDRPAPAEEVPPIGYNIVTPGYFETMGVALRQGRGFVDGDLASDENVVIINRTAAERFWPGESPIGKEILGAEEFERGWARIVGVVDDIRQDLTAPPHPEAFVPLDQEPVSGLVLAARVRGDPGEAAATLERITREFDRDMPVTDVGTLRDRIGATLSRPRFNTILMTVFAGVALLLACVGVYGVLSYTVAQRRREFGIRMAVGADRRSMLAFVLRDAAGIGLLAAIIGLAGAAALSGLIRGLLFDVAPVDPAVILSVGALVVGVATLAGLVPAWSATAVDPVATLREE